MLCFQGHARVSTSCRRPCEFSHCVLWLFVVFPLKHGMLFCHPGFELLVLLSVNLQPAAFSLCFIPFLSVYLGSFSSKKNQHRLSLRTAGFSTLGSTPTVSFGWPRSQMPLENSFETPSVQPTLVLHIISLCFLVRAL